MAPWAERWNVENWWEAGVFWNQGRPAARVPRLRWTNRRPLGAHKSEHTRVRGGQNPRRNPDNIRTEPVDSKPGAQAEQRAGRRPRRSPSEGQRPGHRGRRREIFHSSSANYPSAQRANRFCASIAGTDLTGRDGLKRGLEPRPARGKKEAISKIDANDWRRRRPRGAFAAE
jgi:hypothetical protein